MQSIPQSIPDAEGATVDEPSSRPSSAPQTPPAAPSTRGGRRPGSGRKRKAALGLMRTTVRQLTTRRLDGRSKVALAVRRWRSDVEADLGGSLSRAQSTILEGAAQKLIFRESLGDYLMRLGSLVTKKRQAVPVLRDYMTISDSLARDLERLGLARVERELDLAAYLAEREEAAGEKAGAPESLGAAGSAPLGSREAPGGPPAGRP